MRLFLLQLGLSPAWGGIPVPGYLIQAKDGTNVLVDTGYTRSIFGRREEAVAQLQNAFPDDKDAAWNAEIIRSLRDDTADFIVNRLAVLGLAPSDIHILICTHFDFDHAGNHDLFPQAKFVVQQRHYAAAREHPRFRQFDAPWDKPELNYRLVEGDTELLPAITLLESSGHAPGHQSVLVRLPETGPVLLAADAILSRDRLDPKAPAIPQDWDSSEALSTTQKLFSLAAREGVQLIVFGHDAVQWHALRKSPEYYRYQCRRHKMHCAGRQQGR